MLEETKTRRRPPSAVDLRSKGRKVSVTTAAPKTFVLKTPWNCSRSVASARWEPLMPALLMSWRYVRKGVKVLGKGLTMSKRPYFFSTVSAAALMESSESRSICRASMSEVLMSSLVVVKSSTAFCPLDRSRQPSRTMCWPLAASFCAAWKPMPWLAPVMRVISLSDMLMREVN